MLIKSRVDHKRVTRAETRVRRMEKIVVTGMYVVDLFEEILMRDRTLVIMRVFVYVKNLRGMYP